MLFDGALGTGPDQQAWLYLMDPQETSSAVQSVEGTVAVLDTMAAQTDKAGYFASFRRAPLIYRHPKLPVLDRSLGYSIRVDVRIVDEVHRVDRAGFGVIALSQDLKGVELEFWKDEVWMQADSPLFTHAEGIKFDTASAIVSYELRVQGDEYRVSADGVEILAGPLRDYSAFGPPYTYPSFLFVGDDTTTAAARIELARVEVNSL